MRVIPLALAFTIGTWVLGWWAIPLLAALAGVLARNARRQAVAAGVAAAVAWGGLLVWTAFSAPLWAFASQVGGAVGAPHFILIAVTLVFPALLAWLAAWLAQALTRGKPATN